MGGLFCVTTSLLIFDVLLTQALSWESVRHVLSKLWSSCNLLQHVQLWDLLVHTQPLHCFLRHPDDTHGWVGSTNSACGCLGFPSTLMQHTESFVFPRNWKSFRWNSNAGTSHPIQPSACSRLFFSSVWLNCQPLVFILNLFCLSSRKSVMSKCAKVWLMKTLCCFHQWSSKVSDQHRGTPPWLLQSQPEQHRAAGRWTGHEWRRGEAMQRGRSLPATLSPGQSVCVCVWVVQACVLWAYLHVFVFWFELKEMFV